MNVVIEYIIVFIIIYIIMFISRIYNKTKYKKGNLPTELLYLNKIYNVKINKNNYKKMVYIYNITNTFIITTIYIILVYLTEGIILRLIIGLALLLLLIIITYGILGRILNKKEGD